VIYSKPSLFQNKNVFLITLNVTLLMSSLSSFVNGFALLLANKLDIFPQQSQIQF
jgi:hypothetical protein